MRILHVLDHSAPILSGYTYRTLSILREQRRLGWETAHVTGPKHAASSDVEDFEGFRFFRTAPRNGLPSKLPLLRHHSVVRAIEDRLASVVPEVRPDVIHAHSPALNGLAALRVARRFRLPFVYEVRAFWEDAAVDHGLSREGGPRYRLTRALETYVLKRADAVTAICEGLKRDILARGVPDEKMTVIPNAVDVEKFSVGRGRDAALARELGVEGCEVIGFLGSFYAYEGLELLVEAFPDLLGKRPSVRLLLVGEGPREAHLKRRARELGIEAEVVFPGRVPHDEVRRYYDLVDVLVFPRVAMRLTETVTPLKPLEAMAVGKLLVASNVGGHRELIRDVETGLLFQAGSKSDLVEKVLRALEDRELGRRISAEARRFVEKERTWQRAVGEYRAVYGRAVDAKTDV